MTSTNALFYFLLMAIFLGEGAVLCRILPLQRKMRLEDERRGRLLALDGLRGLLAFSVFVHHAASYIVYTQTGRWLETPSRFYEQIGVLPVSLFFMITGYLFWSKLIRRPSFPLWPFAVDRVRRLCPAYIFACVILFSAVAIESGFHRNVSLTRLLTGAVGWLSFLGAGHDLNGIFESTRMLGQVWTLRIEWIFYLLVPFLGWFARRRWRLLLFVAAAALLGGLLNGLPGVPSPQAHGLLRGSLNMMRGNFAIFANTFSVGMFIATVPVTERLKRWFVGRTATVACVALLALTAIFLEPVHGWRESLMLAIPFAAVCWGNSWLGILNMPSVRSLGRVSYSFYLLHNFALYGGGWLLSHFLRIQSLNPFAYWSFAAVCGTVGLVASYISYQYLEYPFFNRPTRPLQPVSSLNNPAQLASA